MSVDGQGQVSNLPLHLDSHVGHTADLGENCWARFGGRTRCVMPFRLRRVPEPMRQSVCERGRIIIRPYRGIRLMGVARFERQKLRISG